jgi:hypothetical protein
MKSILTWIFICVTFWGNAQNLSSFTATIQVNETAGKNYLSIVQKKSYSLAEAKQNKSTIDLALVVSKGWGIHKIEWHNMSGKEGIVPAEMTGTGTVINGISLDKDQFAKCKTNQDLKKMTGHITNNSFSHIASVCDDIDKGINYHCFIIQMENGKRVLLWIEAVDGNTYTVTVKVQA